MHRASTLIPRFNTDKRLKMKTPKAQGLYDPQHEHDNCGIGLIVDMKGRRSHGIVRDALEICENLDHRGGCGCDPITGDLTNEGLKEEYEGCKELISKINVKKIIAGGSLLEEVESIPLSRIKKISGKHLSHCWETIPHVTQFDEVNIEQMERFRKHQKERGIKLTPLVFIMKAVVQVLKQHPNFNSSLDESGENLLVKKYFNLGVAMDTPEGLVVPVIRDVGKKSLVELADELAEISTRAREGQLDRSEMQGAGFTISSLGGIGGTHFTPIINSPEVAILGVSRTQIKPVWNGESFVPTATLPIALSYDHRVIDGAQGARFIADLNQVLKNIMEILL